MSAASAGSDAGDVRDVADVGDVAQVKPTTAAVVLAGGSGSRLGADRNKVLLDLGGIPVLAHCLRTAASLPRIGRIVVVARREDLEEVADLAARWAPGAQVVVGGADRPASERAALAVIAEDVAAGRVELIAVHDGARPLAGAALWLRVLEAAAEHGGALPARPLGPVIALDGPERSGVRAGLHDDLVAVSTPQAFDAAAVLQAYAAAEAEGFSGTDTASFLERYAPEVRIATVPDPETNVKITWPGDLELVEQLIGS